MARRVSMPAADDLFRPTAVRAVTEEDVSAAGQDPAPERKPSGRVRHDEKMTVYVTSAELFDIEQSRLVLRSRHGLAVDRGRLVREAVAMVLADFSAHGEDSALVQRLTEE